MAFVSLVHDQVAEKSTVKDDGQMAIRSQFKSAPVTVERRGEVVKEALVAQDQRLITIDRPMRTGPTLSLR